MPETSAAADRISTATLSCDLLIFDLDGTLIDSQQDLANSVNATLMFLHRQPLEDNRIAEFIGDGAAMLVRRALEVTGDVDEVLMSSALPFFLQHYRAHKLDFTYVYPGVLEALQQIREASPDLLMAVLTNKPVRPSRQICDGLGLSPFFFQNYGGDSFPLKKPNPLGAHTLMQEAGSLQGKVVDPQRTVMIGDSHVDIETARNAGIRSIGCTYGLAPEKLRASGPDATVDHASGWLHALQRLFTKQ
jgi:phosphoglycolate phosphatase